MDKMKTLTPILFLIATLLNIYYFSITLNTNRYLQNQINNLKPQTIVEVVEKENCVECEVCPPCTYENVEAIPLEKE